MSHEITALENEITRYEEKIERARAIWDKPFEALGAFATGRSNRPKSLDRAVDAENNRKEKAFSIWQSAKKELKRLESKLVLLKAGEIHANGQRRADAPSRQRRQEAQALYALFLRSILKPGDDVKLMANEKSHVTIKRLNKKTITTDSGSTWEYAEILPLLSRGEINAALKVWKEQNEARD